MLSGADSGSLLKWCLVYHSMDVGGMFGLLQAVAESAPGQGPLHLLVQSAAWDCGEFLKGSGSGLARPKRYL